MDVDKIRNRLLASLAKPDLSLLIRHLRQVPIEQGQTLEDPSETVDRVYFPQSGLISLIVSMAEDAALEVGIVGNEGAIGMTAGLGSRISFIRALVQVSGTALCIPLSRFHDAASRSPRIRAMIARYGELVLGQIQQTAACNGLHGRLVSALPLAIANERQNRERNDSIHTTVSWRDARGAKNNNFRGDWGFACRRADQLSSWPHSHRQS